MLDPPKAADPSKRYEELCVSLKDSFEKQKGNGNRKSRHPPRHKSTPSSSPSAATTSKPTHRRNSSRNFRLASSRMLQLDAATTDSSDSSMNVSGLSLDAINTVKNMSGCTMNTSRGSMDSSASSTPVDPAHSPLLATMSPTRSTEFGNPVTPRRSSSRISDIRREMSQSMLVQKGNDSKTSLGETGDDVPPPTNRQIVPMKSPSHQHRILKRKTTKKRTSANSVSPRSNSRKTADLTWKRNSTESKKNLDGLLKEQPQQSPKKVTGGSMRNLLRNKRRLEKELHSSDVFHFVLHKAPPPCNDVAKVVGNKKRSSSTKKTKKKRSEEQSGDEKRAMRMPLDQFMLMKLKSEQLVMDNDINSRQPTEEENGEWHTTNAGFPRSAPASQLYSLANSEMTEINDGEEEDEKSSLDDLDQDDTDDDESVVSLDIHEALGNEVGETKESRAISHDSCIKAMSEEMESQSLSLHLADLQLDDVDCHSSHDSERSLHHVENFAVTDPAGRKGVYSGLISRRSGMPCGQGRLEYLEEGEIFEGQFVHGYWTGYGRCIYTRTGEDYTGTFLDSIRHGHGICKYQDGRVFEGTYTNGVKTEGKMTYQDGSTYLGHWYNGARHGRGTYTFANGSVYFGEFDNDRMHGSGVLTWSNGTRYVGAWKNGQRHGPGKEFRPNGTIRREGVWREGAVIKN